MKQSPTSFFFAATALFVLVAAVAQEEFSDTPPKDASMVSETDIQRVVDMETKAWNDKDADALVSLFHPDMVWPWSPSADSHDPATWEFPQGRFNRERWTSIYQDLFASHDLVHNIRETEGSRYLRRAKERSQS